MAEGAAPRKTGRVWGAGKREGGKLRMDPMGGESILGVRKRSMDSMGEESIVGVWRRSMNYTGGGGVGVIYSGGAVWT